MCDMGSGALQAGSSSAMITDVQLALIANVLGVVVMSLVVVYHYVTATPQKQH